MKRPYVFLCTAMSLDGKISTFDRIQAEIATDDDKQMTYDDRIACDAIYIGAGQLRLDDPKLTVKTEERQKQRLLLGKTKEPIKVAVVSDLSTIKNTTGDFFTTGERIIIFTTERSSQEKIEEFKKLCDVYICGKERVNLKESLEKLYELRVRNVMVEGGGELIFSLIKEKLVDEIHLKIGNLILGGKDSPTLADGLGFIQEETKKVKFTELIKRDNYIILKCKFA